MSPKPGGDQRGSGRPSTSRVVPSAALIAILVFAFISIFSAVFPLTDWSELARLTLIYYVALLAGGIVLLGTGLGVMSRRFRKLAFFAGGLVALVLLANQMTGLHLQSILCHTPS